MRQIRRPGGFCRVHPRPGWFMQNFQSDWHPMIMGDGVITLPAGDSKTAFIDARDIADVAAVALSGDSLDGPSALPASRPSPTTKPPPSLPA